VNRFLTFVLILSSLLWLTACERIVQGDERAAVLGFSDAITDNLFAGLNANDYAAFARDFDTDMLKDIPAEQFAALKQNLDDKLGTYVSRSVARVARSDEFYVVDYLVTFEQEEVQVTLAFHAAAPQKAAFLSFTSKTISWSTFE
jgi:hypothetical protein